MQTDHEELVSAEAMEDLEEEEDSNFTIFYKQKTA